MLSQVEFADLPGRLIVRYDVDTEGRTRNIELIEGDPLGYWDSIIVDHVDGFIFRPAVIAGEPVESVNRLYEVRYSHQE